MTQRSAPQFRDLSSAECRAVLDRNHVGRLAFSFHDRVDVEPLSYVFADGQVYARTSPGAKVTMVRHHPYVAFEVDEIEGRYDWRSVVVHGTIYFLDPAGGDREREAFARAEEVLRQFDAEAMTGDDATPFRTQLFRIFADEITGRAASTARD